MEAAQGGGCSTPCLLTLTTPLPVNRGADLTAMSVLWDSLAQVNWPGLGHSPGSCGSAPLDLMRAASFPTGSLEGEEYTERSSVGERKWALEVGD